MSIVLLLRFVAKHCPLLSISQCSTLFTHVFCSCHCIVFVFGSGAEKGPCVVLCALSQSQVARTIPGGGGGNGNGTPAPPTAVSVSASTDASASVAASDEPPLELVMCGWRGRGTLRLYMPRHERVHMLTLLGAPEHLLKRITNAAKGEFESGIDTAGGEKEKEKEETHKSGAACAAEKGGSELGSRTGSRPGSPTSSTGAAAGSDLEFIDQRQREIDADLDAAGAAGEPAAEQPEDDEGRVQGL